MTRAKRRIRQRPSSRLGRRGAALITFGILWLAQGAQVILFHGPVPHAWLLSHYWRARAAAWIIAGLVAIWAATRRPGRDWPGFMALYLMGFWVVAVLADAFLEAALAGSGATPALALTSIKNACILAWVVIANGWREPMHIPDRKADR